MLAKKVNTGAGWDGEHGPFFEEVDDVTCVNYASIDRSDYVGNALQGTIQVKDTSGVTSDDLIARMEALQRCVAALPPGGDLVSRTRLWLVRAEAVSDWSRHTEQADSALAGPGLLYEFAEVPANPAFNGVAIPGDLLRRRIAVDKRFQCQISANMLLFRQADDTDWTKVQL